jgi:hypothetical protein
MAATRERDTSTRKTTTRVSAVDRLFRAKMFKERVESIHQRAKEVGIDLPLPKHPWWDEEISSAISDIRNSPTANV